MKFSTYHVKQYEQPRASARSWTRDAFKSRARYTWPDVRPREGKEAEQNATRPVKRMFTAFAELVRQSEDGRVIDTWRRFLDVA